MKPTYMKQADSTGRLRSRGGAGIWTIMALIIVPAVLAMVGFVGLKASGSDPAAETTSALDTGQWFEVTRQSFDLNVVASGELEAKKKVEVKSQVKGRQPIIEVVEEGTFVKQGDVLVTLQADDINDKIEQEQLNVEKARADHITATQNLEIEKNEATSSVKTAEVELALAQLDLDKWLNGEVPQKRRELDLSLDKAVRRLARAERDHKLSVDLAAQKFISLNELEDSDIEKIEADNALETAKLAIAVYDDYTYQREEKAKNSTREQAEGELDRTIRKNQSKIARMEADLNSKTRTLAIREDRLAELETQLVNTTITAPQAGMVVYATSVGSRWQRRDPIVAGREVRFNETLILLPDTRQMVAALRVHESRLSQIQLDQKATLTIDARPGQTVPCKVIHIGVTAEDGGWWNPNLREYKIKVELPVDLDDSLKPAMRCSGEIILGRVEDALAVPIQAVFSEGEDKLCYMRSGRKRIRRQVITIGRASESLVEILSGLESGQQVLMRKPEPGEEVK
jgi:HlyD family secretion protein